MNRQEMERLQDQIANAERVLAMPEVIYPNCKSSHEVWDGIKEQCLDEIEDARRYLIVTH